MSDREDGRPGATPTPGSAQRNPAREEEGVIFKGRTLACENLRFFIYFDHIVDAHGGEVPRYLVVSPKAMGRNYVSGVAILPISDGRVGLVRVYRPALRRFLWELPHGFLEEDEEGDPKGGDGDDAGDAEHVASALRELLEETGLSGARSAFRSLGYMTPDSGIIAGRTHLYVAEGLEMTDGREHEMGLREFRFVSFEVFEDMVMSSQIEDSFALAAWCRYRILRRREGR